MAETKRGRLGVAELAAATNTAVYEVTDTMDAEVNIFVSNAAGTAKSARVNVAIVDGGAADIADEDYLIRDKEIMYGEYIKIEGVHMAADEAVVVYSTVAGVTVRVSGVEEDAASGSSESHFIKSISETVAFDDFTDVDTTGYVDMSTDIPAGAIVLGWRADVTEGFASDTTAVMQVGVEGDVDAFSADTTQSVLTDDSVAMSASLAATAACTTATTPRITVTGAADFTSIDAGEMTVEIFYLPTA